LVKPVQSAPLHDSRTRSNGTLRGQSGAIEIVHQTHLLEGFIGDITRFRVTGKRGA